MITSYKYKDPGADGWHIGPCTFGKSNLLVGESGSGKTRCLNTIFNISNFANGEKDTFRDGEWEIELNLDGDRYKWSYSGADQTVLREVIAVVKQDSGSHEILVDRDNTAFIYQGVKLPKLSKDKSALTLLKDEDSLNRVNKFFSQIFRRSFQNEDLLLMGSLGAMANIRYADYTGVAGKEKIGRDNFPINLRMKVLQESQKGIYDLATRIYQSIFPKISGFSFVHQVLTDSPLQGQVVPIFRIHEQGVTAPINFSEMSSGMQKVLCIITDILLLPKNSVYLIDEYENSLGINAIDFLPDFLEDHGDCAQFIITTHHPYLINNMPIETWKVFKREGSIVKIFNGIDLQEKYGRSKQTLFTQLINDPIYSDENS